MACSCSLEATTDRLAPGSLTEPERVLLRELEHADLNSPAGEAHMLYEEQVFARHLKPGDRYRLFAQHAVIRSYVAKGVMVPLAFLEAHQRWERELFPTLGTRS
jgi:hypothetical protein